MSQLSTSTTPDDSSKVDGACECFLGFDLNKELVLYVVNVVALLILLVVIKPQVSLQIGNFSFANLTDAVGGHWHDVNDGAPFNCRLLSEDPLLQYNDTFVCVDINATQYPFEFSYDPLDGLLMDMDREKLLEIGKIGYETVGNGYYFVPLPAQLLANCTLRGETVFMSPCLTLCLDGYSNAFVTSNGLMEKFGSEVALFDRTVSRLYQWTFDYRVALEYASFCRRNVFSDYSSKKAMLTASIEQFGNVFLSVKAAVCERYFKAATYTCNYRSTESGIEFTFRVSGWLMFVDLFTNLLAMVATRLHDLKIKKKI